MKKIILGILIFFGFFHSALALNIVSHSSIQTNCDGGTFPPLVIYGTGTYHLWDYINTVKEGIISSNSEVSIYIQGNKVSIPNGWVQTSNYMPTPGQFYAVWNNQLTGLNISSLVPSDRDTPVAQIVYRIKRMLTGGSNTYNFGGNYTYANFTGNTPVQTNLGNLNKNFDPSTTVIDNECITIIPRWCGDGVIDSTEGESCDLGVQNGQPGSTCNSLCEVPTALACIPGTLTGPQLAPVTVASPGLCPVGQTVGDFTALTFGTTTNYSWSCNGSAIGGACSASYNSVAITPTCSNLTATPTTGATPLTVNFAGTGSNLGTVDAYRIVVRDNSGATVTTLSGANTSYVFNIAGIYTAQLYIDGSDSNGSYTGLTAPSCTTGNLTIGSFLCTPGTTTGVQASAVTAVTSGLCPVGQTVGDFTALTLGTTTNYSWSCNGSAIGGACSASYTSGGGGLTCTPGNFVRSTGGVVPAPISVATAGLCPVGEVVGNFTDTTNGTSHSYAWSCNTISAGLACTAFYSPGGGGGGSSCQIGSISGVQITPITLTTPGLCVPGRTPSSLQSTSSNGIITYSWSCDGVSGCSSTYIPSAITIPGANSYCGNGAVERPNSVGVYENCDTTALWCDNSCSIALTNPGSVDPGKITITNPGSSSMSINTYRLIIGDQVPVFSFGDVVSFETTTPMYLQNKTATITNRSLLLDGQTITKPINNVGVGGVIRSKTGEQPEVRDGSGNIVTPWTITYNQNFYPSSTVLFQGSELQGFKGKTNNIAGSYEDTIITNPTYRGQGFYASLQYLESPFNIRVSLPIIGNTAGGSAFIGGPLGYSVNTVVQTFLNNLRNGNFTTSTVNVSSLYALSSATRSVNDTTLSQSIATGNAKEIGDITQSSLNSSSTSPTVMYINSESEIDAKSTSLGDTAAIRVFKDGNVSIDGDLHIAGVKTVIVENGDLIINKDIRYADTTSSFAWIVKNGNIIMDKNVTYVAGVYVALNGNIISSGGLTPNRLTVEGSLYGNTSDLVNNRSYVRGQTGYSALNMGIIVNYSNRAIMYPPPFLSRFLDQYSLQRVVK